MKDKKPKYKSVISDESKVRILNMLDKNSNVVFVNFKG